MVNSVSFNIKIQNEKFGNILTETFADKTQFKIFLSMIQGCIELKNDLTFFNGQDFLVHIPHRILVDSVIVTNLLTYTATEHVKSKIESLITK